MFLLINSIPSFSPLLISRVARLRQSLEDGSVPDHVSRQNTGLEISIGHTWSKDGEVNVSKSRFDSGECLLTVIPRRDGITIMQHLGDVYRAKVGFNGQIIEAEGVLEDEPISLGSKDGSERIRKFVKEVEEKLTPFVGDPDFNPEIVKSLIGSMHRARTSDSLTSAVTFRDKNYKPSLSESPFGVTKKLSFKLDDTSSNNDEDTFSEISVHVFDKDRITVVCNFSRKEGKFCEAFFTSDVTKFGRLVRSFFFDDIGNGTETFDDLNHRAFIEEVICVANSVLVNREQAQLVA